MAVIELLEGRFVSLVDERREPLVVELAKTRGGATGECGHAYLDAFARRLIL